jgi:Protein of unknown function (DUF1353)
MTRIIKPENPILESIDGDSYAIAVEFPVKIGLWLRQIQFVIPKGMETDIASIPWFLRWGYDRASLGILAPTIHDYLCDNEGKFINVQGEKIQLPWFHVHAYFLILLLVDRIDWKRSLIAFLAVVIGGPKWKLDPNW